MPLKGMYSKKTLVNCTNQANILVNILGAINDHTPLNFRNFSPTYFLYRLHCKFYPGEPSLSAVCIKNQNLFIVYTAHFWSVYIPKVVFFSKKVVYCVILVLVLVLCDSNFCNSRCHNCGGALLKKRKYLSL